MGIPADVKSSAVTYTGSFFNMENPIVLTFNSPFDTFTLTYANSLQPTPIARMVYMVSETYDRKQIVLFPQWAFMLLAHHSTV